MRKILFFSLGFIGTSGALLFADEMANSYEATPKSWVNSSSRLGAVDGQNLFVTLEGLVWIAQENGLIIAQTGQGSGTGAGAPAGSVDFRGSIKRIRPNWDWGFRFGFGYDVPYDQWEFQALWTHYITEKSNSASGNLLPLWAHPDLAAANTATHARGQWNLRLNVFDFDLGRPFWVGKHFSLKPYFGLRLAWIDQIFKVHYDFATSPLIVGRLHAKSDFSGAGLRLGLDGRFAFKKGFSIYGVSAFSLLYGRFETDFSERENGLKIADADDDFHSGLPTLQLALGLQWDTYLYCHRYHLGFNVGWEQNLWFSLNQMNHFLHQLNEGNLHQENGNLTLQGISFGARFDF